MIHDINVRAMCTSDINSILELWTTVSEPSFLEKTVTKENLLKYLARNPNFSSVVSDSNNKIIGALLCGHDGIRGFIYHLAINSEHRSRTIADLMLDRSLKELKDIGINRGFIFTKTYNYDMDDKFNSIGWCVIPNNFSPSDIISY